MIGSVPYLVSLLGECDNVSAGAVRFFLGGTDTSCVSMDISEYSQRCTSSMEFVFVSLLRNMRGIIDVKLLFYLKFGSQRGTKLRVKNGFPMASEVQPALETVYQWMIRNREHVRRLQSRYLWWSVGSFAHCRNSYRSLCALLHLSTHI
jgi:hypothetical protein